MLAKAWSATIQGVDTVTVEVEVSSEYAMEPSMLVVGLPDAAVRESRERVKSAMFASGLQPPDGKVVVNLAPADVRKEGSAFDLPIALGMVASIMQADRDRLQQVMAVGELALDGSVRPVHGVLALALHAQAIGFSEMLVPAANAEEAAVAQGIRVYGIRHLHEAVALLNGSFAAVATRVDVDALFAAETTVVGADMAEIKGQETAKRALEIAAAGGHNCLFVGPPGSGKTMLAQRLPSVLPPLTVEEALEVTRIHSIAGVLPRNMPIICQRPFCAPHHTVSDAGLLGGQSVPRPGQISLAHNGVLFLDELPEFKRSVLEVLRQPLESGDVTICRASGTFCFPARFMLVAAMNPCPCGHYGGKQRQCRCGVGQIQNYRSRVSGPLLDRIDIHVEVAALDQTELLRRRQGESSSVIRQRVLQARAIQKQRFAAQSAVRCNAQMTPAMLDQCCQLSDTSVNLLRLAITDLKLSARAYDRILRLARTLADLDACAAIGPEHVHEAVQYRTLDRDRW